MITSITFFQIMFFILLKTVYFRLEISKVENKRENCINYFYSIYNMIVKQMKEVKKISSFILKLHSMLNDEQNKACIGWADLPNAFVIYDTNELAKSILAKYYKHNNLSSFIRQLNIYDFDKVKVEEDVQLYHHPFLSRNDKSMLKKIQRKHLETHGKKKQAPNNHLEAGKPEDTDFRNQKTEIKELEIQQSIDQVQGKQEIQIKKVTNFFTSLLRDLSAFGLAQISELSDIFNHPQKRREILQKSKILAQNPSYITLNARNNSHQDNLIKKHHMANEEQNNTRLLEISNHTPEQSFASPEEKVQKYKMNKQDQGFLPLEAEDKYDRKSNMNYQKLYE